MSEGQHPLFGVSLENVPIVNLRQEFNYFHGLLSDDAFRSTLVSRREPMYTDYVAYPTKRALLTHMVQRAVMGIESYLPFAVIHESGLRGTLRRGTFGKARDPFSLGGRSTVANYYDRLPSLVSPECSLRVVNDGLYQTTVRFYREIRNPLFHGYEIRNDESGTATLEVLNHIHALYKWIDSWCPPGDITKKSRDPQHSSNARATVEDAADRVVLKLRIPTLRDP